MEEIDLKSWEEFEEEIKRLENYRKQLLRDEQLSIVSDLSFRGQANSEWGLETALERFAKDKRVSLTQYYSFAYAAKTKLETFTERKWNIPEPSEFSACIETHTKKQKFLSFEIIGMPVYEYLAFLRHHGYPSPLLDWTYSPYIAAFFAFRNIPEETDYVSIYANLEDIGDGKSCSNKSPCIFSFGSYGTIHKRHVLQQSAYTICYVQEYEDFIFAKHDKADDDGGKQDKVWKFNLPASERQKVLKKLNQMNINAYSLFLTLDSLVEYIATFETL